MPQFLTGIPSPPIVLLLDSVLDPHNMGALIRTACCVGASAVVVPRNRSAGPTPTVSKTSAGALEHVAFFQVTNLTKAIQRLKAIGLWIVGMQANAAQSIYQADLTGPMAVVIGGEQKGMRPLIRQSCDFLVSIPQTGPIDSLNASVAGAIVMYEIFRQRTRGATALDPAG
jgi:23S rRNA (guanosine2251-2'-O)-methyltransferase